MKVRNMAKKYHQLGKILKKLLFDNNMKAVDLAREVNLPAPTIHRLITGKSTRPYPSSLKPIADFFSVTIDQLLGEEPISSNNTNLTNQSKDILSKNIIHVPILPWNSLSDFKNSSGNLCENVLFAGKISGNGFATIMQDSSMEPIFSKGNILIFDPLKQYKDRSYVLVYLQEAGLHVFRQLLIDLNLKYLKPLNSDLSVFKMRVLEEKDKIIATLVEARQIYDEC